MKNISGVVVGLAMILAGGSAVASDLNDIYKGEHSYRIEWECTCGGEKTPTKDTRYMHCKGFWLTVSADNPGEADAKFDIWWPQNHPNETYTSRRAPVKQ